MVGSVSDPSTNLVPGKNFVPPPGTPDSLSVSVTPGSSATVPITTGYDQPSRVQMAATQLKQPEPAGAAVAGGAKPPEPGAAPAAPAAPTDVPSAVTGILGQPDPRFDEFWNRMLPGESGGKNVPNYRYDRTHTASGTAQITDTNWKEIAPRLGIDVTRYPTAMSAPPDYQKAVTKLMFRMYGQSPWDSAHGGALPPGGDFPGQVRLAYDEQAAHTHQQMEEALKQLNLGKGDLASAMEQIRKARGVADQSQDAAMRALGQMPEKPVIDGVKHMSSLATIVGLLGGLMTKAPMLASTNAAAAAIEAYNAGDLRSYNIAMNQWKTQTDFLFKIADMNAQRVRDITSEEKIPLEERRANLDAYLRAAGLEQVADQARIHGIEWAADWANKQEEFNLRKKEIEARNFQPRDVTLPDGSTAIWSPYNNTITPYPAGASPAATSAAGGRVVDENAEIRRRDDKFKIEHPGATTDQIREEHYKNMRAVQREGTMATRLNTSDLKPNQQAEFDRRHDQFIKDNPDADVDAIRRNDYQNYLDITADKSTAAHAGTKGGAEAAAVQKMIDNDLAEYKTAHPQATKAELDRQAFNARLKYEGELAQRNRRMPMSPSSIWMQQWMRENPNASADQIARATANYTHWQTVEKSYANGPIARNVQALNTVADHIKEVRDLATELTNNGKTPRFNAMLNRLSTETGWEGATNFRTAAEIMSGEIVRLLTSTGGTGEDRDRMQSNFDANMSPEQIGGALDVAERMVAGRFKALEQGYAGNDPRRRQTFEGEILTQDSRDLFLKHGQGTAASGNFGATQDDPVRLPSPDDVDNLLPGTYYIDPRDPGHVRQK